MKTAESLERVMFVMPNLRAGGAERVVLTMVKHLQECGLKTTLFVVRGTGRLLDEVPPTVRLVEGVSADTPARWHAGRVCRILRAEAESSDVVVAGLELMATYWTYAALRTTQLPLVAWVHTHLGAYVSLGSASPFNIPVSRVVYRRFNSIVCPSAGASESLQSLLGIDHSRIAIIHNPLDLGRLRSMAQSAAASPTVRCPGGELLVSAMGRMTADKGFDILLRAFAIVLTRGVKARLTILGDGPMREDLSALARALRIEGAVRMPGFASNPYTDIACSDLFVSSSRCEGFSLALAEAMALGVAVVATDCPSGPREILDNGRYGALVPAENPAALADAIADVLSKRDRSREVVSAARERAEMFSTDRIIPQWHQLISGLVAEPATCARHLSIAAR